MEIVAKEPNWFKGTKDIPEYNVSVFFSSRGRPGFTKEAVKRLYSKAANPNRVQTIIRLDNDDEFLKEYAEVLSEYPTHCIIGPRYNGYESLHIYYDECAALAKGKYLWQINDDGWVVTDKWDKVIIEYLSQFKNDIFTCSFDTRNIDGIGKAYDWAFPIMSRRMYELLGRKFCYGDVKYIDTILFSTAKYLNTIKQIPVIIIHQHIWDRNPDKTSAEGCLAAYKWFASHNKEGYSMMDMLGKEIGDIFRKNI